MTKRNGGFSLVEVLVAIVLLGATIVPISTALVTSLRINDRTESMLQAQLDVSSAVEHLMAEGITEEFCTNLMAPEDTPEWMEEENSENPRTWMASPVDRYCEVYFDLTLDETEAFYEVYITDVNGLVEVHTFIRNGGAS